MTAPRRIQRQRTKGWRMPENTVYVGRPSVWGSPYVIHREGKVTWDVCHYRSVLATYTSRTGEEARADAVYRLRQLLARGLDPWGKDRIRVELAGKNLACWCPLDQPCHADVLLEIANREEDAA